MHHPPSYLQHHRYARLSRHTYTPRPRSHPVPCQIPSEPSPPQQRPQSLLARHFLKSPSTPRLDDLPRMRILSPQHRPTHPIGLCERQFHFRPHDLKRILLRLRRPKQHHRALIPLRIRSVQVEFNSRRVRKRDTAALFVDFLEVERGDDC